MRIYRVLTMAMVLILLFLLSACSWGAPTLSVISYDYEGLHTMRAGEIDKRMLELWSYIEINPYYGYMCHISEKNGMLFVSSDWEYDDTFIMCGNNGYFVGVDIGEFDGWVTYYPYYSVFAPEIVGEPRMVAGENCRGLIGIDDRNGYALTGLAHLFTDRGALYRLSLPEGESDWTWSKVADLPGCPRAYDYHEEAQTVYIVTSQELLALSTVDDSLTVLADLDPWRHSGVTSVVALDGKVYVGMGMGIYEYDLATGQSLWYPLDFEKYVDR